MESKLGFISAVAFDLDGLSLNTEELYGEAGRILMERRGKLFREEIRRAMTGLPAEQAYDVLIGAESLVEDWRTLLAETELILAELLPERVRPMPGLCELLDQLDRKKIPRCVATSSTRRFAESALQLAGVRDRMDFIVTAEDVPRGKPAPDIYLLAMKKMESFPHETLVLEDSPTGTRAGLAAGCHVVAIPSEHVHREDFPECAFLDRLDHPNIFELLRT